MSNQAKIHTHKLTLKQSRFVDEYMTDFNAAQAAIRAGYSSKTAKQQAYNLLQIPQVRAEVDKKRREQSQTARLTADALLDRLQDHLDADLADLFDEKGNLKPVNQWPLAFRTGRAKVLNILVRRSRATGLIEEAYITKVIMSDTNKLMETLGKFGSVRAFDPGNNDTESFAERLYNAISGNVFRPKTPGTS